jgi:uncharacterized protein YacL (UPF0231 family)
MENNLMLSLGSIIGILGLFYTFHKDSKITAQKLQKMETEIEQLKEHKRDIRDLGREISAMKSDMNEISNTLIRIDTNVSNLMDDKA